MRQCEQILILEQERKATLQAASDLLAACKAALPYFVDQNGTTLKGFDGIVTHLRAAITQAEGRPDGIVR